MNLRTQIAQTNELGTALQLASEASAGMQGILYIADGAFKGMIYFENGRIVGARLRESDAVSMHALQEIINHRQAGFLYDDAAMPEGVKRISFAFQELLKDGLRLPENQEPIDPAVVGKSVDTASMATLTTPIKFDPSMFPDFKRDED